MKIGWIEIALIIAVVIAVAVIARIIRPGRIATQRSNHTESGNTTISTENRANRHSSILTRTGIALIAAGGIALIAGASMLKWVLHNYVLSVILIACGMIIFIVSRRKR